MAVAIFLITNLVWNQIIGLFHYICPEQHVAAVQENEERVFFFFGFFFGFFFTGAGPLYNHQHA